MSPVEQNRDSIIAAAAKLFVDKGFAGTSMSMIAREAEVTQSLIHYHFKTKRELWTAVKIGLFEKYSTAQQALFNLPDSSDPETFRAAIGVFFRFAQENPDFLRLSLWRTLEGGDTANETCFALGESLFAQGAANVQEAQERGLMRPDVPGLHMIIVFLSVASNWFSAKDDYMQLFPDMDEATASDAFLESLQKIVMEGILPR